MRSHLEKSYGVGPLAVPPPQIPPPQGERGLESSIFSLPPRGGKGRGWGACLIWPLKRLRWERWGAGVLLALALLAGLTPHSTPAAAQEPDPHRISYGDTVTGTLGDDQYEQRWTFSGRRGELVRVVMGRAIDAPGGLDGYLLLLGPDGSVLLEMDDSGDSVMPVIEEYELPADGVYTLVATRFGFANGYSVGEYSLTLAQVGVSPPVGAVTGGGARWLAPGTLPPRLRWLSYNEAVSGVLSDEDSENWFIFQGSAGDDITLRMVAGESALDPFLILTDSAGYELVRADDAPDGALDAVIAGFSLPADGSYLVRATRYGFEHGPSAGSYTLIIETEAAPVEAGTTVPEPLTPGVIASGALDLQTVARRYTLSGGAGDRLTVVVERTTGTLDPALALRDPGGSLIAASRAWLDPAEARISRVELPADGVYTLEVILDDLSAAGAYRLVAIVAPPSPAPPPAFVPTPGLDLEAVLLWTSAADLDLDATGPAPGTHEARAHDFCAGLGAEPVERLTWAAGTAAPGLYAISVQHRLDCTGGGEPVRFVLGVASGGVLLDVIEGVLAREGDVHTMYLALP